MSEEDYDFTVLQFPRHQWPKKIPPLSNKQKIISDNFMKLWHETLPKKYSLIESFNHNYPRRILPKKYGFRTLEIGAGLGEHINYEKDLQQEYYCVELRENMANVISERFPDVHVTIGDVQETLPYSSEYFDRVIAIHVLEHLPNLPNAIREINRVLKDGGIFTMVIPCDPGLAYEIARKISAERLFIKQNNMPYSWLVSREHINSPGEIISQLRYYFSEIEKIFYPLRIPIINFNLCIGITTIKNSSKK